MMTSTTTIDSQRAATSHRRDRIFLSVVDTYENMDLNRGSFNDTSDRVRVSAAQVLHGPASRYPLKLTAAGYNFRRLLAWLRFLLLRIMIALGLAAQLKLARNRGIHGRLTPVTLRP
jgi:hypothetical protein